MAPKKALLSKIEQFSNWWENKTKGIILPGFDGLSLYDLWEIYSGGIIKGTFSTRASAIAFSFFMALFPFLLFMLNLIPYISLLEADSLSSYVFLGGTVDHFLHQWVALRDVHEEARRARDRNFLSRGEFSFIRAALAYARIRLCS